MDAYSAAVAVDLLDLLDGGDEAAGLAVSGIVEHLETEELALRRHPRDRRQLHLVVGDVAVFVAMARDRADLLALAWIGRHGAGDDPGHMGVVAELVDQRL